MSDRTHVVESVWQEADAAALEARVLAMSDWLDHTEDLVEMFGDDKDMAGHLRSTAGFVRTRKSDLSNEAQNIRARMKSQHA